jgi:hypothetical protein
MVAAWKATLHLSLFATAGVAVGLYQLTNRHAPLPWSDVNQRKKSRPTLQSIAATKFQMSINSQGADDSRL